MRILYVEDEEIMRDVFAPMLKEKIDKCALVVVHSGNQAIQILKSDSHFDLIISDYKMPDGHGGKLLEYVTSAGLSPYFILFTNTIEPDIEISNDRFLGVISKFHFKELLHEIEQLKVRI